MEFLKYVFSLLKDENERSAEHEVAGITSSGNIIIVKNFITVAIIITN